MADQITPLPTPVPSTSDPANFDARADATLGAFPQFVDELNEFAASLNNLSTTTSSVSSVAIGTGTKNFIVDTGKSLFVGMSYRMAYDANNWMNGEIISYDSGTGVLSLDVDVSKGSGTYAAWVGTLSFNGQIETAQVADEAIDASKLADDAVIARVLADSALGFALINGTLTASVASNALTIAIKTKAGADPSADDPVLCVFRNAALATGDYVVRSITAATSLVISSGSTLGTTSGVQSQIDVVVIDSAGTVEISAINDQGAPQLDGQSLISTTAEGGVGGADSYNTFYSTTARSNVPYRYVGYIQSTQATAGSWATAPSKIQLANGPLLKSLIVSSTPKTTTGGTAIDFDNIPSWVKRITIMVAALSTNGTSNILVQIGDSGGIEATGYSSAGGVVTGAAVTNKNYTTGFGLNVNTAANSVHGSIVLSLLDASANTWVCNGQTCLSNSNITQLICGSKSLSATLDRVRITAENGTDTFDAGTTNIMYE